MRNSGSPKGRKTHQVKDCLSQTDVTKYNNKMKKPITTNLKGKIVRPAGGDGLPIVAKIANEKAKVSEVVKSKRSAEARAKSKIRATTLVEDNRAKNKAQDIQDSDYKMMLEIDRYMTVYDESKSVPGNLTKGTDKTTSAMRGMSVARIDEIIRSLKDRSFQFKPAKRIYIPQSNGKMRPLGIPSPMDKLVLKVFCGILEEKFEPLFLDTSHGFRPGKSCHTAIKEIYK